MADKTPDRLLNSTNVFAVAAAAAAAKSLATTFD